MQFSEVAGMNPDEMYVRERLSDVYWDKRFYNKHGDIVHLGWSICSAETEEYGWQAARAFTEQREEEIRCAESGITLIRGQMDRSAVDAMRIIEGDCGALTRDLAPSFAACSYGWARLLLKQQAALSELTRGMVGDGK